MEKKFRYLNRLQEVVWMDGWTDGRTSLQCQSRVARSWRAEWQPLSLIVLPRSEALSHTSIVYIYCYYLNKIEIRSPRIGILRLICAVPCYPNMQEGWNMCIQWKCSLWFSSAKYLPYIFVVHGERDFAVYSWFQITGKTNKWFTLLLAPIISFKIPLNLANKLFNKWRYLRGSIICGVLFTDCVREILLEHLICLLAERPYRHCTAVCRLDHELIRTRNGRIVA